MYKHMALSMTVWSNADDNSNIQYIQNHIAVAFIRAFDETEKIAINVLSSAYDARLFIRVRNLIAQQF